MARQQGKLQPSALQGHRALPKGHYDGPRCATRSELRWHNLGCPELEVWAVAPPHQTHPFMGAQPTRLAWKQDGALSELA
jgi:hypothetical protein